MVLTHHVSLLIMALGSSQLLARHFMALGTSLVAPVGLLLNVSGVGLVLSHVAAFGLDHPGSYLALGTSLVAAVGLLLSGCGLVLLLAAALGLARRGS